MYTVILKPTVGDVFTVGPIVQRLLGGGGKPKKNQIYTKSSVYFDRWPVMKDSHPVYTPRIFVIVPFAFVFGRCYYLFIFFLFLVFRRRQYCHPGRHDDDVTATCGAGTRDFTRRRTPATNWHDRGESVGGGLLLYCDYFHWEIL